MCKSEFELKVIQRSRLSCFKPRKQRVRGVSQAKLISAKPQKRVPVTFRGREKSSVPDSAKVCRLARPRWNALGDGQWRLELLIGRGISEWQWLGAGLQQKSDVFPRSIWFRRRATRRTIKAVAKIRFYVHGDGETSHVIKSSLYTDRHKHTLYLYRELSFIAVYLHLFTDTSSRKLQLPAVSPLFAPDTGVLCDGEKRRILSRNFSQLFLETMPMEVIQTHRRFNSFRG